MGLNQKLSYKYYLFLSICAVFLVGLSFSEALISIFSVGLFVQSFFQNKSGDALQFIKKEKSLWALVSVYFIFLIGFIFCKDLDTGLYELTKNVFWLIIPTGVALSVKLNKKQFWGILILFVLLVTIASLTTTFKVLFSQHFMIDDIRDASFVSHVSFSLYIVFSIFILLVGKIINAPFIGRMKLPFVLLWALWLLVFLGVQKSLTGVISLFVNGLVFLVWYTRRVKSPRSKTVLKLLSLAIVLFPLIYIGISLSRFYTVKDENPQVNEFTAQGNQYTFSLDNQLKENGRYVHWYVCKEELRSSWLDKYASDIFERDTNGYTYYSTLLRYMTSKGLRKDAQGFSALSEKDLENVRNGVSNHIFAEKKFSVYPRVYQTIWEIDYYFRTGNPNNQSVSQRLEYNKAALLIIKNKWWGVGTGNYKNEFEKVYNEMDTQLNSSFRFNVHNQFLSYAVKFGVLGLILIMYLIYFAIREKKAGRNILLHMLLTVIVIASLGGDVLESHTILPFFTFFLSLILWHNPTETSNT